MNIIRYLGVMVCLTYSEWHAFLGAQTNFTDREYYYVIDLTKTNDNVVYIGSQKRALIKTEWFSNLFVNLNMCHLWRTTGPFKVGLGLVFNGGKADFAGSVNDIVGQTTLDKESVAALKQKKQPGEFVLLLCGVVLFETRFVDIMLQHSLYSISYDHYIKDVPKKDTDQSADRLSIIWQHDKDFVRSWNSMTFISKPKKFLQKNISVYL